jgi:DNA-3-methyladenine glycosylase II
VIFTLRPRGPLDFALTARVLRRSTRNPIDVVSDGGEWSRVVEWDGRAVRIRAWQEGLLVRVAAPGKAACALVERMFGLDLDLNPFWRVVARDLELATIACCRGLRPQRFASLWDAFANGICCQQLSLDAGLTVLGRLAMRFGPRVEDQPGVPIAARIARATPAALRACGLSGNKARALGALARLDTPALEAALERLDDATARERLLDLPGIGPWTADYILLRGLGRLDVFPHGDVGVSNALSRMLGRRVSPAEAPAAMARFAPFRGMIYFAMRAMAEYRSP